MENFFISSQVTLTSPSVIYVYGRDRHRGIERVGIRLFVFNNCTLYTIV